MSTSRTFQHRYALATTLVAVLAAASTARAQAKILWVTKPIDATDPSKDVRNNGQLCVAANLGPETNESVVNGVHFQQDRSFWTQKLPSVGATGTTSIQYFPPVAATSGGYVLKAPYNRTAGGIGPGPTHSDPDYKTILADGRHRSGSVTATAVAITCSVEGLTPGKDYMVQIWCGNKGRPTRHHEWDNGQGGRGTAAGGIYLRSDGPTFGEVATGFFTADNSGMQTFTNYHQAADPNATPPILETWGACSAIQVRDVSNVPSAARATYYGVGTPGTQDGGRGKRVGGSNWSPGIALDGHPLVNSNLNLSVENSSGAPANGMIFLGVTPASVPFLGGTLLVTPILSVPVVIPFDTTPNRPYTHDHELKIPVTAPASAVTLYCQILQLDPGAAQGVSFTPGLKIEVGM